MSTITDTDIKKRGLGALMDALGEVDAERFIMLLNRDPFDYTSWQHNSFKNTDIRQISAEAMEMRKTKK
ncbi:hypothetical protein [Mucilaginibacter sp. HD30]